MFATAPILKHFHPEIAVTVETDASDFALGRILSERYDQRLHPVEFHSPKFTPAEINYDIHDKELLAIVDCFKMWRRYLEIAPHQVQIISDHNNLELLTTDDKPAGLMSLLATTLKYTSDRGNKTERRITYLGVRSIAFWKGRIGRCR